MKNGRNVNTSLEVFDSLFVFLQPFTDLQQFILQSFILQHSSQTYTTSSLYGIYITLVFS